jgi:hypothetical protein
MRIAGVWVPGSTIVVVVSGASAERLSLSTFERADNDNDYDNEGFLRWMETRRQFGAPGIAPKSKITIAAHR